MSSLLIFKYQVHLESVRPMYCISCTAYHKPVDPSGELVASVPLHKSERWEAWKRVDAMLLYRKKTRENKAKQKPASCMSEIVKRCGNQMLSKYGLKVPVISYCCVYVENVDSRENQPQPYICWSSSVCKSSLAAQKVVGNAQHGIAHWFSYF